MTKSSDGLSPSFSDLMTSSIEIGVWLTARSYNALFGRIKNIASVTIIYYNNCTEQMFSEFSVNMANTMELEFPADNIVREFDRTIHRGLYLVVIKHTKLFTTMIKLLISFEYCRWHHSNWVFFSGLNSSI